MSEPDKNPFRPPPPSAQRRQSNDMSIEHEPHFGYDFFEADETEQTAGTGRDPLKAPSTIDDDVEHGVWDEPALAGRFAGGVPEAATTYQKWLATGQRETTRSRSAVICLFVALFAGPWAIVGTFVAQFGSAGSGAGSILTICLIGPLIEEVLKASGLLWIVEKRPYLLRHRQQIWICAIMSGLWFAVIENFLYLNVYIPNASAQITLWRWTVCVLLHVGCTLISGVGLARVWQRTMSTGTRPQIALASPFIIAAVICHAAYNSSMLIVELLRGAA